MAPLIVANKLESLRANLARIEARTPGTAEELAAREDLQESVILNLARAVQNCTDIGSHLVSRGEQPVPTSARGVFEALAGLGVIGKGTARRLAQATAFRNLAIHRYDDIDWAIVHRVCRESLVDLRRFAEETSAWLSASGGD